ncbi:hypothetical protein J6590_009490 [Homalodisca vitripennis]|nr:hypothetical protein J6590_009490 [Homalodisca vitripennis]
MGWSAVLVYLFKVIKGSMILRGRGASVYRRISKPPESSIEIRIRVSITGFDDNIRGIGLRRRSESGDQLLRSERNVLNDPSLPPTAAGSRGNSRGPELLEVAATVAVAIMSASNGTVVVTEEQPVTTTALCLHGCLVNTVAEDLSIEPMTTTAL